MHCFAYGTYIIDVGDTYAPEKKYQVRMAPTDFRRGVPIPIYPSLFVSPWLVNQLAGPNYSRQRK